MKTITPGRFGLIITLGADGLGTISSDLHEDGAGPDYCGAMNAIESMILAHACTGIDVSNSKYLDGIQIAVESIANNRSE